MFSQFIKFCVVGFTGMVVDFGITFLCKEKLRLNKYISNSLGFVTAASSNYFLNRLWTFESHDPKIAAQYIQFVGISAQFLSVEVGGYRRGDALEFLYELLFYV